MVVVTGGGGNFGRAGAEYFHARKAKVVGVDVMPDPLAETMKSFPDESTAISVICDITKEEQVAAMTKAAVDKFGRIDMLWNNAGYQGAMMNTHEYPTADFQRVMDINVVGSFNVMKSVANAMRETGGGTICNTASVAALRGTPTMPACKSFS